MAPRVKERYQEEAVPALMKEFGYGNVMPVPRPLKMTINIGLGEAVCDGRALDSATNDVAVISGQKPVITRARRSIANFKLREGMPIGVMVTMRGNRMWESLDRLGTTALPRIRDFQGVSGNSLDARAEFRLGIREQV